MEVEDEEDDMMVIKTKTIVLEDDLKAARKVKEELQKVWYYMQAVLSRLHLYCDSSTLNVSFEIVSIVNCLDRGWAC